MQQWEFLRDARRAWYWRRTDSEGSHSVSSRTFTTHADCVADAVEHGYAPPAGKEPRETRAPGEN